MAGMVKLLAFDAIVGNNDRHPLNWGIIVPLAANRPLRFSPIFDSARGLFWNLDDSQLGKFIHGRVSMNAYIRKSRPQIGYDGMIGINHFNLIEAIYQDYEQYRGILDRFANPDFAKACCILLEKEFAALMSKNRRRAICECLTMRIHEFCNCLRQREEPDERT
jgi:hypothetical protein